MKEGVIDYLPKPIDLNELEKLVSKTLGPVQVEIRPKTVTLVIDDREVKAEQGTTILEAAHSAGIDIPTLCYHKKLAPYGACRLCTVEIVRGQQSQLVASCCYPVVDGLVVKTESEQVVKGRKMLLKLMWARAPGIEALRNYRIKYGITGVKTAEDYGISSASTTKFEIEPTFCILCGLCVRYCAEVKGRNAIGFIGRGTEREVVFLPEIARDECSKCEECFPLCPTGALPSHFALIKEGHPA
ncbi:MAG: (2Fe-2S)-binding protein [Dehalococcoidales bacterium]|nr:(2Fe-2S)-binding protein [Dehalococcoidales bacterium]